MMNRKASGKKRSALDGQRSKNDKNQVIANASMQRTSTILEMTRWQEDSDESLVEIIVGNESDELVGEEDAPVLLKESESITETQEETITSDAKKTCGVDAYMASREMTEHQERWNALTMIPSPLYCIYYILAGKWITTAATLVEPLESFIENRCIHSTWFPHLHAMPPLPILFVALGIVIHAPFSFIYHWKYAHTLPPGIARTDHLSRRLDQAMIHVASAFITYATSASWEYFLANALYNADCFHRQFHKEVSDAEIYVNE